MQLTGFRRVRVANHPNMLMTTILTATVGLAAQSAKQVITLDPADGRDQQIQTESMSGKPFPIAPANFHRFGEATIGRETDIHKLTLRFAKSAMITRISTTKDFGIEQGGSCVAGKIYAAQATCSLLVHFTPQGPGNRVGKIAVENTAAATPSYVGLGGNGYAPVVSFTPSVITTVPSTISSGVGILSSTQNIAVDGGDQLYIADTGNKVVRAMDSSANLTTISQGSSATPAGVAVDSFGEVFFSDTVQNTLYEIFAYDPQVQLTGSGTDACSVSAPCDIQSEKVFAPGPMAMDGEDRLFFTDNSGNGAAVLYTQPYPGAFARLYDPFTYQISTPTALSVDAADNIYTAWQNSSICQISSQTFDDAANDVAKFGKAVGGKSCGFAGDGGQARNAEIGDTISQITFDVAGNLYFTDTSNQRVRRVDQTTGIITTIAGNGTAAYSGDGEPATSASLKNPTGVAVDSQGQVYVVTSATGPDQVIRVVGTTGAIAFGSQTAGTSAPAKTITVANTGNAQLELANVAITGDNASDFTIDANTTSCKLTSGSTLDAGQSCKVGVIFKPKAAGARAANLVFLDNTVTNSNTVQLSGTGSLETAALKITSPATNTKIKTTAPVKFSVQVNSASSPAPTGKVTFKVDGSPKGSVTLSSGVASINVSGLTTGTHWLSATYSGNTFYAATPTLSRSIAVTK